MKRMLCMAAAVLLLGGFFACQPKQSAETFAEPTALPSASALPTEPPVPEPTETPAEEKTPAPTAEPTAEPTPEPITRARLDAGEFDDYFNDAVFVGDSMTKEFGNYVRTQRDRNGACLGTAQFMGAVSMTVLFASTEEPVFNYRGGRVSLTAGINKYGAKKVFIMLGANDIGHRDWDAVRADYCTMIERILSDCPGAEIVVEGINPGTKLFCANRNLDVAHWNSFNEILKEIAEQYGLGYFSFAEELMDEQGYLRPEFASGDLHLSASGNEIWVRAARAYAAQKLCPDAALDLSDEP